MAAHAPVYTNNSTLNVMKKHLLKGMLAAAAMLTGVLSAEAAPDKLYMCGPATSAGWAAEIGVELTKTVDGENTVFTYEGAMNSGDIIFMAGQNWDVDRYAPEVDKTELGETAVALTTHKGDGRFDYHWIINSGGTWKLTVTFMTSDNTETVVVAAKKQTAPAADNLYIVGDAAACGWDIGAGIQMTKSGDGVFTYEGDLYRGDIIITAGQNWDADRYAPEIGKTILGESAVALICPKGDSHFENHWTVNKAGTWKVTITLPGSDDKASIAAEWVCGPSSSVIPLGAASNQWNSAEPNNLVMTAVTPGVYQWEGTVTPTNTNQFKFISRTGAWDSNIDFYLPAETDGADSNIKTVEIGMEYPVTVGWVGNGNLETYWSLPVAKCTPFKKYKVTLTLTKEKSTIKFEGGTEEYVPEHMYIVGTASPSLWNPDMLEMTAEGNGVFSYRGNLYQGEMRFLDIQNFGEGISYVPCTNGTQITDTSSPILQIKGEPERNWGVSEYGEWEIKVTVADGGNSVSISAQRLGDMTPQVYALGHATGAWDCQWPTYSSYILPTEEAPNVFVWEGSLTPDLDKDNGNDLCRHFKFIAYPKAWDQGCIFYVPAEVDYNGNVQKVEVGVTYPVSENTAGNGELDWFWGFPQEQCTADNVYKVTLDLNKNTISFADAKAGTDGIAEVAASDLRARFIGDNLVVEGAASPIAVYDIAGRLLAISAEGSLTVAGLPGGVYVVKTAESAVKVAK